MLQSTTVLGHVLLLDAREEYLPGNIHQSTIEQVIMMMRKQIAEPLTLNDMADMACLSPYYFNRVFHRTIGLPPYEFLAALRLESAKKLLLTTDLPVTDICFAVGYQALGSFTSRFTQQIGISPRHLRVRMRIIQDSEPREADDEVETGLPDQLRTGLSGVVRATGIAKGPIFIGAFPKAIPQGKPASCCVLQQPGFFHLGILPPGCYYVMAAAFPLSRNHHIALIPNTASLVASVGPIFIQGEEAVVIELPMRPPRLTDPPILTALLKA